MSVVIFGIGRDNAEKRVVDPHLAVIATRRDPPIPVESNAVVMTWVQIASIKLKPYMGFGTCGKRPRFNFLFTAPRQNQPLAFFLFRLQFCNISVK